MIKRSIVLIYFIIGLLLTISSSYSKQRMTKQEIEEYINSKSIIDAHIAICNYDENLCKISSQLIKDFADVYNRMYISIVKVESGNYRYRKGLYYKYDYGLPQINVRVWNKQTLRKFGFNIYSTKQLIYNDKLALDVGYVILWHNIVYGFVHGKRYRTILEYVSHYHSPVQFNKYYYYKVRKTYYKIKRRK